MTLYERKHSQKLVVGTPVPAGSSLNARLVRVPTPHSNLKNSKTWNLRIECDVVDGVLRCNWQGAGRVHVQ
jgi:hypothetical protein